MVVSIFFLFYLNDIVKLHSRKVKEKKKKMYYNRVIELSRYQDVNLSF